MIIALVQLATISVAQQAITESGVVFGIHESGLNIYKGVPFAAPPIGDLRWRPPIRVAPWTGSRKADAFAPACMQSGVSMPGETPPTISEDCLYLNIWSPTEAGAKAEANAKTNTAQSRLPVFVWIYGGGYTNGSASMPMYWG